MRVRIIKKNIYHGTTNPCKQHLSQTTGHEDQGLQHNMITLIAYDIYMYSIQPYMQIGKCDGYFNFAARRKRSHDHPPFKQLGIHHIRQKLFPLPLLKIHSVYNSCLENRVTNPNSNECKFTAIVLDIASHRLFKPVNIKK